MTERFKVGDMVELSGRTLPILPVTGEIKDIAQFPRDDPYAMVRIHRGGGVQYKRLSQLRSVFWRAHGQR